jgi:hypothetical protein
MKFYAVQKIGSAGAGGLIVVPQLAALLLVFYSLMTIKIRNKLNAEWSERLRNQTHLSLLSLAATPTGRIHFKHKMLGYADADIVDLLNKKILLKSKRDDIHWEFSDTFDLIKAGWVID